MKPWCSKAKLESWAKIILHKVTLKRKRVIANTTDITKRLEINSPGLMKLN